MRRGPGTAKHTQPDDELLKAIMAHAEDDEQKVYLRYRYGSTLLHRARLTKRARNLSYLARGVLSSLRNSTAQRSS
jgi:hypothetical protein